MASAKGVGGNIPLSSSFSTWGAMLRWMPDAQTYIKGGVFMAYPDATSSSNSGLWFGGNPTQTDQTGLMGMVELGWMPRLGQTRLLTGPVQQPPERHPGGDPGLRRLFAR